MFVCRKCGRMRKLLSQKREHIFLLFLYGFGIMKSLQVDSVWGRKDDRIFERENCKKKQHVCDC